MRSLTPIERMIDAATGFDTTKVLHRVTLRCPLCGQEKKTLADRGDPKAAAVVLIPHPECVGSGEFPEPVYLDADGRELLGEEVDGE